MTHQEQGRRPNLRATGRPSWRQTLCRFGAGWRRLVWLSVGSLVASTAAMAGSPTVDITVTALPSVVTYSRPQAKPPLLTRAAYEISITNNSTNTINNVQLDANTAVVGAGEFATYLQTIGAACAATNATGTAISCQLGQLRGGGDFTKFVVIFNAPSAVSAPAGDQIQFNWTAAYGEGLTDSTGASHIDTQTGQQVTALGTPTNTEVKTFVPPQGGSLFTGLTGVATAGDPWTTTVAVPSTASAQILEAPDANSCSADYLLCVTSTLTIPGTFSPYLSVTLRRDASTIAKSAKIANAHIYYEPGQTDANGNFVASGTRVEIFSCDLLPNRLPNSTTKRCIDYRREYKQNDAPTPDFVGDWEFGLRAIENGRMSW